jgi:hypothetical protein
VSIIPITVVFQEVKGLQDCNCAFAWYVGSSISTQCLCR